MKIMKDLFHLSFMTTASLRKYMQNSMVALGTLLEKNSPKFTYKTKSKDKYNYSDLLFTILTVL